MFYQLPSFKYYSKHCGDWPLPGARISQHLNRDLSWKDGHCYWEKAPITYCKPMVILPLYVHIYDMMVYIQCNTSTDNDRPTHTHTHPWLLTNGRQFLIMILCKFRTSSSKIPRFIHAFGFPFPVYIKITAVSPLLGELSCTVRQTIGLHNDELISMSQTCKSWTSRDSFVGKPLIGQWDLHHINVAGQLVGRIL